MHRTLCPGAMSATAGGRSPACSFRDGIAVFSFNTPTAVQFAAGVWSLTMYWTPAGPTPVSTVSLSAGGVAGGSCAGFVASIPNLGSTWLTTFGALGVNTTSPFTVSTSLPQAALSIPAGGSLCLRVEISAEPDDVPMVYDGPVGTADTRLIPPIIVVPESLIGLLGLAIAIPLVTGRRRLMSFLRLRK